MSALAPAVAEGVADHPRVRQALVFLELWLDGQRAYESIPGISVAVVHDQQVDIVAPAIREAAAGKAPAASAEAGLENLQRWNNPFPKVATR